jgi:hypothetical protein
MARSGRSRAWSARRGTAGPRRRRRSRGEPSWGQAAGFGAHSVGGAIWVENTLYPTYIRDCALCLGSGCWR